MRKVASLLVAGLAASTYVVIAGGTAGGTAGATLGVLGCAVYPAHTQPTFRKFCTPDEPSSSYTVQYDVAQTGSTSYAWTVPAPWSSQIVSGCQSYSPTCTLTSTSPAEITVSVTLFPSQTSGSATAELDYCGKYLC